MTAFVDELVREHGDIRRVLRVLSRQLEELRNSREPDWDLLKDTMYYLTRYPDLFHHGSEDVVFRQLHKRDDESRQFVRDLGREHGMLRDLGLDFLTLCEDATAGVSIPAAELYSCGQRYLTAQQRHMRKEEETVFPRIRARLTAEDWSAIQEDLDRMAATSLGSASARETFRSLNTFLASEARR